MVIENQLEKIVEPVMSPFKGIIRLLVWVTMILVSMAVGFAMVDSVLKVRFVPEIVTIVAGWIVIVLTLLSVILNIIEKVKYR